MGELKLQGIAASPGIAIGPAFRYVPVVLAIPDCPAGPAGAEMARFTAACQAAHIELEALQAATAARIGEAEAAIFGAHLEMLDDPMLVERVQQAVERGATAEAAAAQAADTLAAMLAGMEDELFAARAADVRDVGRRILRLLLGLPESSLDHLQTPAVIVASDLTPSDTARLDPNMTLGFCTAQGGLTAHSAILARTLGIPAVVGLGEALMDCVGAGSGLIVDGASGVVVVSPEASTQASYQAERAQRAVRMAAIGQSAQQPARTANGRRVEVAANIGEVATARKAVEQGAEGVGLLRTEFLYLNDAVPPSEEKQLGIYREIFEALGDRPVIVRTLDIGGDKPPSYMQFEPEMNPFLGWRAIRICLDDLGLFKTQLRAILRAAVGHPVRIMFPMISSLDELRCSRAVVREVEQELTREGLPFAGDVPIGIMVETPAAAVLVDVLCEAADFFSLGTNDLTQYTLAVDRGNPRIASLFQPLHPAVLRLIQQTIDAAHARGKWVGMCGELAGMPKAIPILLGMGLDEFSMAASAIPEAKFQISTLSDEQAQQIACQALSLGTAAEVEALMERVLAQASSV
jgi:phosphoenolpyruvate-protein phosphotransferase